MAKFEVEVHLNQPVDQYATHLLVEILLDRHVVDRRRRELHHFLPQVAINLLLILMTTLLYRCHVIARE